MILRPGDGESLAEFNERVQPILEGRDGLLKKGGDTLRWPFADRVEHTTVKHWITWYRYHGSKVRHLNDAAFADYYLRELKPYFSDRTTKVQREAFIHELGFAREWAQCGFPQVVVGDRLFASFAATRVPSDAAPELGLPWDAFIVRIPERFRSDMSMDYVHPDGTRQSSRVRIGYLRIRRNLAPHDFDRKDLGVSFKEGEPCGHELRIVPEVIPFGSISCAFTVLSDILNESRLPVLRVDGVGANTVDIGPQPDEELEVECKRTSRAMRRAFAGVVLELMSPKRHGSNGEQKTHGRRKAEHPSDASTIVLRRDVVVDCRDWLENHLRGDADAKRVISVQTLVRGHWKRQAYGPGASDRKYIHIEPYWRGPEDAPIAVRSHVLGDRNH